MSGRIPACRVFTSGRLKHPHDTVSDKTYAAHPPTSLPRRHGRLRLRRTRHHHRRHGRTLRHHHDRRYRRYRRTAHRHAMHQPPISHRARFIGKPRRLHQRARRRTARRGRTFRRHDQTLARRTFRIPHLAQGAQRPASSRRRAGTPARHPHHTKRSRHPLGIHGGNRRNRRPRRQNHPRPRTGLFQTAFRQPGLTAAVPASKAV